MPNTGTSLRVLHVTERLGGGLAEAMVTFSRNAPQHQHHLLYSLSDETTVTPDVVDAFATSVAMKPGLLARLRQIRTHAAALGADIVHAHSSFAGVYVRLAIDARRTPIIYSPHCFAFERGDLPGAARTVYRVVEHLAARNTSVFATCSERESSLARSLGGAASTVYVPNVADGLPLPAQDPIGRTTTIVTGGGRLSAQKAPSRFARLARELSDERAEFVWVGGGKYAHLQVELEDASVAVTGWVPKADALRIIAKSDLYVHTAEWEGFPLALLESISAGVPTLVVRRPYSQDLPEEMLVDDVNLVSRVRELIGDDAARAALHHAATKLFETHTPTQQAAQLARAYAEAERLRTRS